MEEKDIARFWNKVERRGDDECWPWKASYSKQRGHGWFWLDGKNVHADRTAWFIVHGPIPEHGWIKHTCNNRQCVNPCHLSLDIVHDYAKTFWAKVQKGDTKECWEFTGTRNERGYGKIFDGEKMEYAHRFSWQMRYGKIPQGLDVCHHCDNPPCVNPAHLFLGTKTANMQDMVNKGRVQRGERHYKAILTTQKVRTIRKMLRQGIKNKAIAQVMDIRPAAVSEIKHGKRWRHVS